MKSFEDVHRRRSLFTTASKSYFGGMDAVKERMVQATLLHRAVGGARKLEVSSSTLKIEEKTAYGRYDALRTYLWMMLLRCKQKIRVRRSG